MSSWIEVSTELPEVNQVVEVAVAMSRSEAITYLRGYRLTEAHPGAESLWLNALTHQPFPDGWRVVSWRAIEGGTGSRGQDNSTHLSNLRSA